MKNEVQDLFVVLVFLAGINRAVAQNGFVWTEHDVYGGWNAVASSADGTKLVAVADSGNNTAYTSTDSGETWTAQNCNVGFSSVASSADGTKLVAASFYQGVYTSADSGLTWIHRQAAGRYFDCVASSADGSKLAVGDWTGSIYTSHDSGETWTNAAGTYGFGWVTMASSADGTKLVAAGGQICTSTDSGMTWVAQDTAIGGWSSVASSADGTKLVASYVSNPGSGIYTSTNSGVTWTAQNSGDGYWDGVASSADGTKLAATLPGQVYISSDSGVTWTPGGPPIGGFIASSADGTKLVEVVHNGRVYTATTVTPILTIARGDNNLTISWPYPSTGWTLQQNSDLATTNWSATDGVTNDGTNNFLTITAPSGNLFCRLMHN